MFRTLTIVSVVVTVAIVLAARVMIRDAGKKTALQAGRFPWLEQLAALVFWLSLVALAGTGFLGATLVCRPLTGYLILLHVACGALIAVSFAGLAVFRAEHYKFTVEDKAQRYSIVQKVCFWLIAVGVLVLAFSSVISMFRLLGTHYQILAVSIHRCGALMVLLAAIVYAGMPRRS